MPLRDRKAYALRAAFHDAVRNVAARLPPEQLETLETDIQDFVTKAFNGETNGRLDHFLSDVLNRVEKISELKSKEISVGAELIFAAMRERFEHVACDECDRGIICDGNDETDMHIVAAETGDLCINEIKESFHVANQLSSTFYLFYWNAAHLPDLMLETISLSETTSQMPGHNLAVNAMTYYDDRPDKKISRVQVRIAPLQLGRECIAALPYLLLHEVFCHGFQMAVTSRRRLNKEAVVDPVSEGMMDSLAVDLLKEYATKIAKADPSKGEIAYRNFAEGRSIHGDRASLDREPYFPEAPAVYLGTLVLETIRAFYMLDSTIEQAEHDVRTLASALNLASWDYASRLEGLSRLLKGLERPRDQELVNLLSNFRRDRNSARLITHLIRPH